MAKSRAGDAPLPDTNDKIALARTTYDRVRLALDPETDTTEQDALDAARQLCDELE
jgi:hypothetical protein